MYNNAHLYDLSFVSPGRWPKSKPQIVFTLDVRHFDELAKRFAILAERTAEESYLDAPSECRALFPDLFGNVLFGYGACGFISRTGELVSLHIELSEQKLHEVVLTIHLLTSALLVPFSKNAKRTNRSQQIDIETNCIRDTPQGYGHSVGGYVSSEVLAWLRQQWQKSPSDNWMHWAAVPEEVTAAMRQAYSAVVSKKLQKYTEACTGSITEDGRFILNCFGNACDVAIYPDSYYPDDGHGARFSCHNLDKAYQQVTLLAGLAKLCELARKEP